MKRGPGYLVLAVLVDRSLPASDAGCCFDVVSATSRLAHLCETTQCQRAGTPLVALPS
ncbi:hypothetical protein M419DRAFT_6256 [Trichoderma reesei RUT C-30]|uniref:Uncharacterized protein n=1 Tax=Hypocrea jecorina (strain ATCC 56765 / BCRC 32924 / NRRL 11460 / Rut C-30) TaxID=1344414 RepID=A0A024SFN5_HYPJR|nr:hypothetical protein M419DRAFT_6256 [Trichoderma reesei RUT C-30]